ncbi:hypothetical protein ACFO4L_01725 [Bacillus daqingensis]|uniref:Uncharacterized protein n=1 Tax=Bacillus daqingensis TaxID=872396 RepID=A0ABV9NT24_9BACI
MATVHVMMLVRQAMIALAGAAGISILFFQGIEFIKALISVLHQ